MSACVKSDPIVLDLQHQRCLKTLRETTTNVACACRATLSGLLDYGNRRSRRAWSRPPSSTPFVRVSRSCPSAGRLDPRTNVIRPQVRGRQAWQGAGRGKIAHAAERLIHDQHAFVDTGQERHLIARMPNELKTESNRGQHLADLVVEFTGDRSPLGLLRLQQLRDRSCKCS